jgi:hypothetical protein
MFAAATVSHAAKPTVDVVFRFGEQGAIDRITDVPVEEAERRIAEAIAAQCSDRFAWWEFRPGAPDALPRLEIMLDQRNAAWELQMRFVHCDMRRCTKLWKQYLRGTGDDHELPKGSASWQSEVLDCFVGRFLEDPVAAGETDVNDHLRASVPLCKGPITRIGEARSGKCVLPLPWSVFSGLAMDEFEIHCKWSDHGSVTLRSRGTCQSMPLAEGGDAGVVVEINRWFEGIGDAVEASLDAHRDHLGELEVLAVYLFDEDPRVTDEAIANCEGLELPAMATGGEVSP